MLFCAPPSAAEGRQPELSLQTLRSDRDQLAHQNAELRAALEREVALREAAVRPGTDCCTALPV